jgi:hypothetical protein
MLINKEANSPKIIHHITNEIPSTQIHPRLTGIENRKTFWVHRRVSR